MITWFYTRLLRLYPRSFYAEFGAEMHLVFAQALKDARHARQILPFLARECWGTGRGITTQWMTLILRTPVWPQDDRISARRITRFASASVAYLLLHLSVSTASSDAQRVLAGFPLFCILIFNMVAWRREKTGGYLLILGALVFGAYYAYSYRPIGYWVFVFYFLWTLPHFLFGVMFLQLSASAKREKQMP